MIEIPEICHQGVGDLSISDANRVAPDLGMLILRGINVGEMQKLGIAITGQNAVDVGRGVVMVAAASAHDTVRRCAVRLEDGMDPESFAKIASVQGQHIKHMLTAGEILSAPDTRPSPADTNKPTLPAYADSPVQQHIHIHKNE